MTAGVAPALALQQPKPIDPSPAARDTEPVVLTGASFPDWAAPANVTAKLPTTGGSQCQLGDTASCSHNQYEQPEVDTANTAGNGVDVDNLRGYRWDAQRRRFVQVPFQV